MQLGMIGLGRMGANMVRRLMRGGHECVVFDRKPETVTGLAKEGATGTGSLEELLGKLEKPRAVWVMVPAGKPTDDTVTALGERMEAGAGHFVKMVHNGIEYGLMQAYAEKVLSAMRYKFGGHVERASGG